MSVIVVYTGCVEFFHVLNRGVEKKDVVKDNSDRLRFVHSLFIFNDTKDVNMNHRRQGYTQSSADRNPLVYIHAWCLMNNHYHLLLSPIGDDLGNLSLFMKKLNMGYAKYFNEKYERSGYLWQGRYKKIPIKRDAHFIHIPFYIHLNPLDYSMPQWREGKVTDFEKAEKILAGYRWSSYLDYVGQKNFGSVIYPNILQDELGDPKKYQKRIKGLVSSESLAAQSLAIE